MSPVVVRSVLNISAAHTLAATPRAGVHKKAETAPGICLLADVTSGWSLCELHCHWTHDWSMCLPEKNTQPQPSRTSRVRKSPPPLPTALCSNPISWEVKKSQKMVEKLDHRGLPAVLLGSYCDQPWASKTQNCTRSYNLHMVRTQLNAQTGTKGLENSISRLENKGTASKHKEVRSSAEMPKQQIVWVAFLTAVVGLGMILMGCLSSRWWGWSTLMGCCQSFGEKKRDMKQRAGVQRLLSRLPRPRQVFGYSRAKKAHDILVSFAKTSKWNHQHVRRKEALWFSKKHYSSCPVNTLILIGLWPS